MRLYFAFGGSNTWVFDEIGKKFNLLNSFAHAKGVKWQWAKETSSRWFLFDSGAYTIWKTGGSVDIKEYSKKCIELNNFFEGNVICVNLDVIPGKYGKKPSKENVKEACKESYKNYLYLKGETGCKIMPVFHQHDDFEWLHRYLDSDDYLLGISPANDKGTAGRIPFLDACYAIMRDSRRTHGLGVTDEILLRRYPFYSGDSSTWCYSAGFGNFMVNRNGRLVQVHQSHTSEVIKHKMVHLCDYIGQEEKSVKNKLRVLHNVKKFLELEVFITSLWEKRGITWKD